MARYYILDGQIPVPIDSRAVWEEWYESADRVVAKDTLDTDEEVSTVFLGKNYQFDDGLPPILFETFVFGGNFDAKTERYHTWEQAVVGHNRIVDSLLDKASSHKPNKANAGDARS